MVQAAGFFDAAIGGQLLRGSRTLTANGAGRGVGGCLVRGFSGKVCLPKCRSDHWGRGPVLSLEVSGPPSIKKST